MECMMIAVLLTGMAFAPQHAARPTYEVAEIKANTSGENGSSSHGSKSQIIMTNLTLKKLIERAYSMTPPQVEGPQWLEKVHFDIAAKYPSVPADITPENRNMMLRTLPEDR